VTTANGLPSITTFTGKTVDFLNPDPKQICIEDIAHALSMNCRFAGQSREFYSVAQHSYYVSVYVPSTDPQIHRLGLLHDATEAFMTDLPRPLKKIIPQFAEIESRLHRAIMERFDLPHELPPIIKKTDAQMFANEWERFMSPPPDTDILPLPEIKVNEGWSPQLAKYHFMSRFRELFK